MRIEPETVYVVPIKSDGEHYPPEGKLRVYRSRTGGNEWEALTNGLPQSNCYVNVLRDAMAVDSLDKCGVYFGTTGGQVYASPDAGDTWSPIVRDLPAVLSVEVQTLRMIRVVLPGHLRTLAHVGERGDARGGRSGDATLGSRCARSALSDAARHHSRSRDAKAAGVHAILRVLGRFVARIAGRAAAGGGCIRSRTIFDSRRNRGRMSRDRECEKTLPYGRGSVTHSKTRDAFPAARTVRERFI